MAGAVAAKRLQRALGSGGQGGKPSKGLPASSGYGLGGGSALEGKEVVGGAPEVLGREVCRALGLRLPRK